MSSKSPREHFLNLTPGKLFGLQQVTDAAGRFKVLALDQSNSFRKSLKAMRQRLKIEGEPTYEEIRDAKVEITRLLGPEASAVLLDVNYGLRQALNSLAIPKGVGLLARLEKSVEPGLPGEVEPGWGVKAIGRFGASAVKLLVYMDTEDKKATGSQMDFVKEVWEDCEKEDILLLVEELSYPRQGEDRKSPSFIARKAKNIIESARLIGPYCDVLKLEFPGDMRTEDRSKINSNLQMLNEVAIRPWVLLSAGEKFEIFEEQVEMTMKAGASGIMAGRAIFNEYFEQDAQEARTDFLRTTGLRRIKRLGEVVDLYATSWLSRYQISAENLSGAVDPEWYLRGRRRKAKAEKEMQEAGAY
jgi:tagatose 1,6-diphosphate aldolase